VKRGHKLPTRTEGWSWEHLLFASEEGRRKGLNPKKNGAKRRTKKIAIGGQNGRGKKNVAGEKRRRGENKRKGCASTGRGNQEEDNEVLPLVKKKKGSKKEQLKTPTFTVSRREKRGTYGGDEIQDDLSHVIETWPDR